MVLGKSVSELIHIGGNINFYPSISSPVYYIMKEFVWDSVRESIHGSVYFPIHFEIITREWI